MKENKDTACEPCEQNFERNINRLVKEGKAVRTYEQRTTIRYQVSEISAFYPDCW